MRLGFVPGDCRVAHEVVGEGLIEVRIEYAEQTLSGDRRTLAMLDHLYGVEPEPGDEHWTAAMDYLHRTTSRRSLV